MKLTKKIARTIFNRFIFVAGILVFGAFFSAFGQSKILFTENFDNTGSALPDQWWSEGVQACVRDGHLFVDADTIQPRVSTIWLNKTFSGNLQIEFDVFVVSSRERSNNINFFLLYSDPEGAKLFDSKATREDGAYSRYHQLKGYIFTHLANGNEDQGRFRFRYNPGFQLLEEKYTYECRRQTLYHVKILKIGDVLEYWTDGQMIIQKKINDSEMCEEGILGFRTYRTTLWWDNLVVSRPE